MCPDNFMKIALLSIEDGLTAARVENLKMKSFKVPHISCWDVVGEAQTI